jgi:RHH-type rel operon transcriptional repressor/antitoxin RelB
MLGVRLEDELDHKLAAIARQRGLTKSDLVREAIRRYLDENELASEARRQSLLVSHGDGEEETLEDIEHTTDLDGWK